MGTIVFSLGIFFFNLTSGQNITVESQIFITILFEELSILISIITVFMIKNNKFEDSNKPDKWLILLNILGAFSVVFISYFYDTSSNFSLTNYLIFLSYIFLIILVILSAIIIMKRNASALDNKDNKVIKISE